MTPIPSLSGGHLSSQDDLINRSCKLLAVLFSFGLVQPMKIKYEKQSPISIIIDDESEVVKVTAQNVSNLMLWLPSFNLAG
jgi:uncharacterized protein YabE (DUF348 family)